MAAYQFTHVGEQVYFLAMGIQDIPAAVVAWRREHPQERIVSASYLESGYDRNVHNMGLMIIAELKQETTNAA